MQTNTIQGQQYGYNGSSWEEIRVANISKYLSTVTSGDNTVWDPTAGKKFRLLGFIISIGGTAQTILLKDGAATIMRFDFVANGGIAITLPLNGYLSTTADNNLVINLSAAAQVAITAWGTEE